MVATMRTDTVTATMQVSIGIDDEEREKFDTEFRTEPEYVKDLAEKYVCEQDDRLRSPQSVSISDTENIGNRTVYHVTVHIMENR